MDPDAHVIQQTLPNREDCSALRSGPAAPEGPAEFDTPQAQTVAVCLRELGALLASLDEV